jgi:hypothetical protein
MSLSDPATEAAPTRDPYGWIDRFAAAHKIARRDV